jgi:hypothetical protein
MAQTFDKIRAFVAGEALEPYRRVKLHTTAGEVVYADASDGDGWIGVTEPAINGDAVALGDTVSVKLRTPGATFKIEASAAVVAHASVYPENDGKVSDDAGSVVIGACFTAASGAGAIAEIQPSNGDGAIVGGNGLVNADLDGAGGLPIVYGGTITFTAGAGLTKTIATTERKVRLIDYWLIARDTTAANIKLNDGTADVTADLAKGTSDDAIVRGTNLIAEKDEIAAAGTIKAISSAACACDVWVLAVPIA